VQGLTACPRRRPRHQPEPVDDVGPRVRAEPARIGDIEPHPISGAINVTNDVIELRQ
jgi:hypothetical protein